MRKRYLIIGAIVTGVLLLLALLVNAVQKGTLEITVPETPNNVAAEVTITYEDKSTDHITIPAKSTQNISVKTGTLRINSSAGEVKAVDIVKVGASGTTKLTLKFGVQHTATKIGTDAEYCPYMVGSTLYTYNCQGDGFIYRHPGPDDRKIPIMDAAFFGDVIPYNAGFLGYLITNPNDPSRSSLQLSFINPQAQTVQKIAVPSGVPTTNMSDSIKVVTSNDPAKTAFAIVVRDTSQIYLFKNLDDTNPTAVTLPEGKKLGSGIVGDFSFSGDTLVAYIGNAVNEDKDGVEDTTSGSTPPNDGSATKKSDGRIFEFGADGKLSKTIKTPDAFDVSTLTKLSDNYYATLNTSGASVYFLRDNNLVSVYTLADTTNALVTKGKLYMVVDTGIFEFTPKDNGTFGLENVYNNTGVRASRIYYGPDTLTFTAFDTDTTDAKLNIYSLK